MTRLLALALAAAAVAPRPLLASAQDGHDPRMAWWREARFGLFIHWGLYSILEGKWEEETGHAEWIRETARIPLQTYEGLLARFDPVRFDADEWARTAKAAGMGYLVVTSKHHDGFCLFDSKETDWDVGSTPFRRDILDELAQACRRQGIRFCTYHSIMDWHHPDYLPRRSWEKRSEEGADFDRFERYLHAQVREIVTRYRPSVMWFDGEWEKTWTHERGLRLFERVRSLDPSTIVNNRVDVHRGGMEGFSRSAEAVGDFATPEQEIPATGLPGVDWETCMTMNDHWGWNARDENWKSTQDLVRKLVDIASKGGNFLLNVGPKPDGTFPEPCVERLRAIGRWMETNGEAIVGTTASPFDRLAWGRCTVKEEGESTRLYLHVFDWPSDGRLAVPGVGNEPRRAFLLADRDRAIPVARSASDLVLSLPPSAPDPIASVVALEIEGRPIVYRVPEIQAASEIFVRPLEVRIEAGSEALEVRFTTDGTDPGPTSAVYRGPLTLADTAVVKARAFHDAKPVSSVAAATFTRVGPLAAVRIEDPPRDFSCERFEGDWDRLPSFEGMEPVSRGRVPEPALPPGPRAEHVALRFAGYFEAPRDDVYHFHLASDDGSLLRLHGRTVVDNDGLHAVVAKSGAVPLQAGLHPIEVAWFNKTGGAHLEVRATEIGGTPRPLSAFAPKGR